MFQIQTLFPEKSYYPISVLDTIPLQQIYVLAWFLYIVNLVVLGNPTAKVAKLIHHIGTYFYIKWVQLCSLCLLS